VQCIFLLLLIATLAFATGKDDYRAFQQWREGRKLEWGAATTQYRKKLTDAGLAPERVDRAMRAIDAYGEAELYDEVYAGKPDFNTQPNNLLVDAVKGRVAGEALDVGMGQGRNSVYLATQGWKVTGFDVSTFGVKKALELARARGVKINAVHSSDEDFDFGRNRWDLIAVIYGMEKRSVLRARDALKPGGIIVVEAGHSSASGAPFEYQSNELPKMFTGFRIIKYEEVTAMPDWTKKPIRLVRFIAEKPRDKELLRK
jgi:SAM-dependent methyltransferase